MCDRTLKTAISMNNSRDQARLVHHPDNRDNDDTDDDVEDDDKDGVDDDSDDVKDNGEKDKYNDAMTLI